MINKYFENKISIFRNNIRNNSKFNGKEIFKFNCNRKDCNIYEITNLLFKEPELSNGCYITISIMEGCTDSKYIKNDENNSIINFYLFCANEVYKRESFEFNSYDASETNKIFNELENIIFNL